MSDKRYYIANNPDVSHARILLAKAAPYDRLDTAFMDMGGGVIFDQSGEIVAYHERHAWLIERRGSLHMTHWDAAKQTMDTIHPTTAGQVVRDMRGNVGITTDAPRKRTEQIGVMFIGTAYPVLAALADLEVIEITGTRAALTEAE